METTGFAGNGVSLNPVPIPFLPAARRITPNDTAFLPLFPRSGMLPQENRKRAATSILAHWRAYSNGGGCRDE